jgi:hypothetical protein
MVQVKVSNESDKNFNVTISLNYKSDEILPYNVDLEFESKTNKVVPVGCCNLNFNDWFRIVECVDTETKDFSDETMADFELHCNPFFKLPLLKAFQEAF